MEWFIPASLQARGLAVPGALCSQAVKELRRHCSLMINFPHSLPLPNLSKQGRTEEQEAEGGEKAGEESRSWRVTATALNFPTDATAASGMHAHLTSPVAQDPSLSLLPPCSARPLSLCLSDVPRAGLLLPELAATMEGSSSPPTAVPISLSSHTCPFLDQFQLSEHNMRQGKELRREFY